MFTKHERARDEGTPKSPDVNVCNRGLRGQKDFMALRPRLFWVVRLFWGESYDTRCCNLLSQYHGQRSTTRRASPLLISSKAYSISSSGKQCDTTFSTGICFDAIIAAAARTCSGVESLLPINRISP